MVGLLKNTAHYAGQRMMWKNANDINLVGFVIYAFMLLT